MRKLRDQYGSGDGVRHERPAPRPRKAKDDDEDDAPVYVDGDTSETISKEDYEMLVNGSHSKTEGTAGENDINANVAGQLPTQSAHGLADSGSAGQTGCDDPKRQENLSEVGTQKKRRKAKVIQEDAELEAQLPQRQGGSAGSDSPAKVNAKKKKKIKLSFEEPE